MILSIAVVILALTSLAWIGQIISAVAPDLAVCWGLSEAEAEVESTFHADGLAECVWDSFTLWTLPLSALLFIFEEPSWTVFSLIGGGMYVYFAGRGIAQRMTMHRLGIRIGTPSGVRTAYIFLSIWGVCGITAIIAASLDLLGR
jgi:hypothetical protein